MTWCPTEAHELRSCYAPAQTERKQDTSCPYDYVNGINNYFIIVKATSIPFLQRSARLIKGGRTMRGGVRTAHDSYYIVEVRRYRL